MEKYTIPNVAAASLAVPAIQDEEFLPESSASSPNSIGKSPDTSAEQGSSSTAVSPGQDADKRAGRRRSTSTSASGDREKRKRSRVTPDQLIHLERFFAVDRSPTAARRREISEMLGMQERQTQIWFQNRRAKAKLLDGKSKSTLTTALPDTPPELRPGYEADLHGLIHEDEPVTIIPCTDLTIGTWRRMATSVGKHDLVAYFCETKRCLTWFIHSAGYGFKMEIPFDSILSTEFVNAAPGSGLATFVLTQPPLFYLENIGSPRSDGRGAVRAWKRCADWTEGMQATKVLRHKLVGPAVQLAHILNSFQASACVGDVRLHEPAYTVNVRESPSQPPSQDVSSSSSSALPSGLGAARGYSLPFAHEMLELEPAHAHPEMLMHPSERAFAGAPLVLNRAHPDPSDYPGTLVDTSPHLSHQQQQSSAGSSHNPSPVPYTARYPPTLQHQQQQQQQAHPSQGQTQAGGPSYPVPAGYADYADVRSQMGGGEYALSLMVPPAFASATPYMVVHPHARYGTATTPEPTMGNAPFQPARMSFDGSVQAMQQQQQQQQQQHHPHHTHAVDPPLLSSSSVHYDALGRLNGPR
ncbi:hypothetical protein EW146_g4024 [Bondarzewia mesenterica]|uniref:Homeobox domain-containing protein n=1 Tax=Bondarzewia mesenterica TaxID=1095465 RepID=A0A4S4LW10_9AGAM|nr:hypothetical protein EW146_g4024 [Bondarzewia mesenterica]